MEKLDERSGYTLPRLSSGVWGAMSILAVLGIPHHANTLLLPDKPIVLKARDEVRWGLWLPVQDKRLLRRTRELL